MKYKAVLSRTTSDQIKSKQLNQQLTQLVLDVYMTPHQYADLLDKYYEDEFEIEVKDENKPTKA